MKMPFTLDAPADSLAVLAEADVTRDDMLAEYRAGKRHSVTFAATTYIHGPNKNHTRLNDAELERFAESFKGQPFLSDHSRTLDHRGGTILDSKLLEVDGKKVIRQTVKAVKDWAITGVLDGTVDRFSIGWNAETYECTACGKDFMRCGHSISDLGTVDKDGKTVEVLMRGIEGMEVSAVTHPAVSGTGVLDALRQLKETVSGAESEGANEEHEMRDKVLAILGLAADTSEKDALDALEARLAKFAISEEKVPAALLTALELKADAATDEVIAAVVTLKAPGNYIPKAEFDKQTDELATMKANQAVREAKSARKITPAMEPWALEFAKKDPASFAAFIAHAPTQGPPTQTPPPAGVTPKATADEPLSDLADHIRERMGVTKDEYLKDLQSERAN